MSDKVYPGLRGDPKFADLLADYDRVSELLGDAQLDLNATRGERDQLTARCEALEAENALLRSFQAARHCANPGHEVNQLRAEVDRLRAENHALRQAIGLPIDVAATPANIDAALAPGGGEKDET